MRPYIRLQPGLDSKYHRRRVRICCFLSIRFPCLLQIGFNFSGYASCWFLGTENRCCHAKRQASNHIQGHLNSAGPIINEVMYGWPRMESGRKFPPELLSLVLMELLREWHALSSQFAPKRTYCCSEGKTHLGSVWKAKLHVYSVNQIVAFHYPLCPLDSIISTPQYKTCVHRKVFCINEYYFRHLQKKPGHNVNFELKAIVMKQKRIKKKRNYRIIQTLLYILISGQVDICQSGPCIDSTIFISSFYGKFCWILSFLFVTGCFI